MRILTSEINFDRFVRGIILLTVVVLLCLGVNALSSVLTPFVVAWVLAYLLFPIVRFLQYKCHIRHRMTCVILTLLLVIGFFGLVGKLMAPTLVEQYLHIKAVALKFFGSLTGGHSIAGVSAEWMMYIDQWSSQLNLEQLLQEEDVIDTIKATIPKVWEMLLSTANVLVWITSAFFATLYLIFMLADYEKFSTRWLDFVPRSRRKFAARLVSDIEGGMSRYLRGQALVALSNCVLFSIGFMIIGLPMPVGMGCMIGIISFVPYIQVAGFVPCTILCLLKAFECQDANFWLLILGVLAVYIVVQVIQDAIITPHIFGKMLGLSPAIILLSLSVWGYVLGIIGLIIALPMTTLLIAYYRHYIIGED